MQPLTFASCCDSPHLGQVVSSAEAAGRRAAVDSGFFAGGGSGMDTAASYSVRDV